MADTALLDRAFHIIMRHLVDTGRAPHYAELARALDMSADDGRRVLHDVVDAFVPSWLFPETDYIASFPPFNTLPTQYVITVGGQQKWFAQCGFESLAMTWMFTGQVVRIDAPCLDCAESITIEMRDGQFLRVDPPGVVGHLNYPWTIVKSKLPFI